MLSYMPKAAQKSRSLGHPWKPEQKVSLSDPREPSAPRAQAAADGAPGWGSLAEGQLIPGSKKPPRKDQCLGGDAGRARDGPGSILLELTGGDICGTDEKSAHVFGAQNSGAPTFAGLAPYGC